MYSCSCFLSASSAACGPEGFVSVEHYLFLLSGSRGSTKGEERWEREQEEVRFFFFFSLPALLLARIELFFLFFSFFCTHKISMPISVSFLLAASGGKHAWMNDSRVSCDELLLLNVNLHGNLGLCRRATEAKQRRKQQSEKKKKLGQTVSNDGGALEASNTDALKSETPQKLRKKKKHHHRKTNEAASSDDQLQIPTSASTILDDTIVQFLKTKER